MANIVMASRLVTVTTLLLLHHRVREKRWLIESIHSNRSSSIHAFGFEQLQYLISGEIVVHEYLVPRCGEAKV
jgi:hypothetical protein